MFYRAIYEGAVLCNRIILLNVFRRISQDFYIFPTETLNRSIE